MEMESDGLGSVDQSKVVDLACSYLEVAPHPIKFSFFWLSDFLFDSMKSNPKFSLKKASEAFHLLESQAVFMIRFPYSAHSSIISSHGMRICIKRKKIHYGKFFDFCAEKCVYN